MRSHRFDIQPVASLHQHEIAQLVVESNMTFATTAHQHRPAPEDNATAIRRGPHTVTKVQHRSAAFQAWPAELETNALGKTNAIPVLKERVIDRLSVKIPATPSVYDLVWNHEEQELLFFTTQKNANEELETLFNKSFKLTLVRLFPYTIGDLTTGLSDTERDVLKKLTPSSFTE